MYNRQKGYDNGISKTWDYDVISQQYSDRYGQVVDNYMNGYPIKVLSKLPVKIYVTVQRGLNGILQTEIEPRSYVLLPWNEIEDGDLISFYYDPTLTNSKQVIDNDALRHISPTHSITKRHGTILVGNVSSYTQTYKRDVSPGGDLSSINVHNMLPWNLTITRGGSDQAVMYIQANRNLDDFTYNGDISISPSVYYDNHNQGVDVGTKFNVFANLVGISPTTNTNKLTYLYSFSINDIDEDRIIIGVISSVIDKSVMTGVNSKNSGRAIYRLGESVNERDSNPVFTPGRNTIYAFHEKYGKGTDKHRNTLNSTKRSTVETARYKQLSGANVLRGDEIR